MTRLSRTEHLEYRRSGYFWRRRIPTDLRFDLKKIYLFSLRTHDASVARELAGRLTSLTTLAFDCVRMSPMDAVDIEHVIADLVRWNLDEADKSRRFGTPRSLDSALRDQARFTAACETLRQAILLRDYSAIREPVRHALGRLGISIEEGSPVWQQIGHEAAHALIDTTEEIARRDRGEFASTSVFFRSASYQNNLPHRAVATSRPEPVNLDFLTVPPTPGPRQPDAPVAQEKPVAVPTLPAARSPATDAASIAADAPAVSCTPQAAHSVVECDPPPIPTAAPVPATTPVSMPVSTSPADPAPPPKPEPIPEPLKEPVEEPASFAVPQHLPVPAPEPRLEANGQASVQSPSEKKKKSNPRLSQADAAAALGLSKADLARCNAKLGNPLMKFEVLADAFLADREAGKSGKRVTDTSRPGGRSNGQLENERSTALLLKKFFTGRTIVSILPDDLVDVFEVVQKLPNTYGRSSTERRHPRQIAEDFEHEEAQREAELREQLSQQDITPGNFEDLLEAGRRSTMSANTVYRKMQETKRIFQRAVDLNHILFNPMTPVIWSTPEHERRVIEEGDRTREIWGPMLPKLFRTDRFQDWQPYDALVWGVLIAVYTGARMEEILQIKVADLEMTDDGLIMHIRAGSNQRLKSASSARRVPIHDALIRLGLVELIESRRMQGEQRLFPELERDKDREKLSTFFSEDFTAFRRKNSVYKERMDFHSFRKGVNQSLLDKGVPREIREALLGHKDSSINGKHYSDGYPIGLLRDAISKLDFDVSMLRNPFKKPGSCNITAMVTAKLSILAG